MNKEDVIRLAKNSKNDEMERQVVSKGYHIGSISVSVGILLLMILRSKNGDLFSQDLLFLIMLQLCTLSIYQFIKIKNPVYLLTFIIGLGASILTLINVLTYYGYI